MNESLPLFDGIPQAAIGVQQTPLERRHEAMKKAFIHADERWKTEYEAFILQHLSAVGPATAEEIRVRYEMSGLPQCTGSKRASGSIFVKLRRMGSIRKNGKRLSRIYGNELDVYERVNFSG